MEVLTELARARCANCKTMLHLMWGDLSGPRWYHVEGGKRTCPEAPTAAPEFGTLVKTLDGLSNDSLDEQMRLAAEAVP